MHGEGFLKVCAKNGIPLIDPQTGTPLYHPMAVFGTKGDN